MQSLSEECTPLKQRYDSCFNLWFEGYLQPALDAASLAQRGEIPQGIPDEPASSIPSSSSQSQSQSQSPKSTPPSQPSPSPSSIPFHQPRLVQKPTSWAFASVFRSRTPVVQHDTCEVSSGDDMVASSHVHHAETDLEPLDTAGMTRNQIKAAQYERQCGRAWREYQGCLRKAIAANQNLTQLLDQAREEHPLHSMDGLEGTAWDPNNKGGE